jgi:hypothetical protein
MRCAGVAEISCSQGCTCEAHTLDAHQAKRESTTQLHPIVVTQAPACLINITVAESTSSGEHKLKISGLIMMDESPGEEV